MCHLCVYVHVSDLINAFFDMTYVYVTIYSHFLSPPPPTQVTNHLWGESTGKKSTHFLREFTSRICCITLPTKWQEDGSHISGATTPVPLRECNPRTQVKTRDKQEPLNACLLSTGDPCHSVNAFSVSVNISLLQFL